MSNKELTDKRLHGRRAVLQANVGHRQAAYDKSKSDHDKKLLAEDKKALADCEKEITRREK